MMQTMKIYLCDDEPKILADLSRRVRECVPEGEMKTFCTGNALLDELQKECCDVLLLDMDMPDISGMDVAERLTRFKKRPLLIFVTSHDELVYDSFQYHPFGFIRKSHFDKEIEKVLDACRKELSSHVRYLHFRCDGQEVRVALSDISYLESEGNYLKLFGNAGNYRFRSTLTAVENTVQEQGFIRVHKGFLVNQSCIQMVGQDSIQLTDSTVLPLGKTYAEDTRKQFMRYLRG